MVTGTLSGIITLVAVTATLPHTSANSIFPPSIQKHRLPKLWLFGTLSTLIAHPKRPSLRTYSKQLAILMRHQLSGSRLRHSWIFPTGWATGRTVALYPTDWRNAATVPVRNDDAKDGLWKVDGTRQVIYAKSTLTTSERLKAARELTK